MNKIDYIIYLFEFGTREQITYYQYIILTALISRQG